MSNLYRGPSIDASYQISVHLGKRFQRRRIFRNQPTNAHLFIRNLVESLNCICGITETVSHFLLDCLCHTTLRQQLFFSLLDIPETISLNLLIFGSVNLNDEENKAVFKRFTPWHAYIIFFTFSILFNLFVLLF
jgi:hypothetical protein